MFTYRRFMEEKRIVVRGRFRIIDWVQNAPQLFGTLLIKESSYC